MRTDIQKQKLTLQKTNKIDKFMVKQEEQKREYTIYQLQEFKGGSQRH